MAPADVCVPLHRQLSLFTPAALLNWLGKILLVFKIALRFYLHIHVNVCNKSKLSSAMYLIVYLIVYVIVYLIVSAECGLLVVVLDEDDVRRRGSRFDNCCCVVTHYMVESIRTIIVCSHHNYNWNSFNIKSFLLLHLYELIGGGTGAEFACSPREIWTYLVKLQSYNKTFQKTMVQWMDRSLDGLLNWWLDGWLVSSLDGWVGELLNFWLKHLYKKIFDSHKCYYLYLIYKINNEHSGVGMNSLWFADDWQ